ncbi:hypothetical protein NW752_010217 [Fusarium irregulare]|nr:hypothetical protein NW752_010217 [Fusarium irregulare]
MGRCTKVRCDAPLVEEADGFGDGDGGWQLDDGTAVAQTAGGDDNGLVWPHQGPAQGLSGRGGRWLR